MPLSFSIKALLALLWSLSLDLKADSLEKIYLPGHHDLPCHKNVERPVGL